MIRSAFCNSASTNSIAASRDNTGASSRATRPDALLRRDAAHHSAAISTSSIRGAARTEIVTHAKEKSTEDYITGCFG
jgi:hypothetical protein